MGALSQINCSAADTPSPTGGEPSNTTGTGSATGGSAGGTTGGTGGTAGSGIVVGGYDASTAPMPDAASACDAADCVVGCGNGKMDPGLAEACDDGNSQSGDGCSADCKMLEKDYACPEPGKACVYLVKCGDNRLGGKETCDDGNTKSGDGCSSVCELEKGWDCVQAGRACTPDCGDGALTGNEQCDPPNVGMGCSAACRFEPGFVCNPPPPVPNPAQPAQCHRTACGDGKKEGDEACDDANVVDGDGCAADCTLEPDCTTGVCVSKCGDGIKLAVEECDDGNTTDGDGGTHDCKQERGFTCGNTALNPPSQLNLLVTYRDFISIPTNGGTRHPDFEGFAPSQGTQNLVKPDLDTGGKPAIDGRCSSLQPASFTNPALCPYGQQLTTEANFKQWYRDSAGANIAVKSALLLPRLANGSYVFDSANIGFFPLDNKGWTAAPIKESFGQSAASVNDGKLHNFGFTTEIRYFFQYRGGESLTFSGDDDVWIFVNRKLALDLGGLHPRLEATLNVDQRAAALGLAVGGLYEVALFHAERHTEASNFKLTLTGFAPTYSQCGPTCGDGIVAAAEQCDLGRDMNTGGYNGCTADCRRGPFCGDDVVQSSNEQCDDGINLTTYGVNGMPGCAPGCVLSGFCGDAKVDSLFGEACDLGKAMNTGAYNGCSASCQLGPRCGDGNLQKEFGEQCDDGNTVSGDGCSNLCLVDIVR